MPRETTWDPELDRFSDIGKGNYAGKMSTPERFPAEPRSGKAKTGIVSILLR
jgi:hypothetical protein